MKNTKKKGFTIVELVIVIAVIAILSAILIPTFSNLVAKSKDAALQSNLRNAYTEYATEAAASEEYLELKNVAIKVSGSETFYAYDTDRNSFIQVDDNEDYSYGLIPLYVSSGNYVVCYDVCGLDAEFAIDLIRSSVYGSNWQSLDDPLDEPLEIEYNSATWVGTSENSAEIYWNGVLFAESVSVETDAETGDSRIVVSDTKDWTIFN